MVADAAVVGVGVGDEMTMASSELELLSLAKRFSVFFRKLIVFDMCGRLVDDGGDEGEVGTDKFSLDVEDESVDVEVFRAEEELMRWFCFKFGEGDEEPLRACCGCDCTCA